MNPNHYVELLKAVWKLGSLNEFVSTQGESVRVISVGEYDYDRDAYIGAQVNIDDTVYYGDVLIGVLDGASAKSYDSYVLQVTAYPCLHILKQSGAPLTQVVAQLDPICQAAYSSLREDAGSYGCAGHISRMDRYQRVAMFTRLLSDRLKRKCEDLEKIYQEVEQNWNETMYIMLFNTMGYSNNKRAFGELARRVKYSVVSRERNSLQNIEALLLGTSGLLDMYDDDSYSRDLKESFEYLSRKYAITPMMPGEWSISYNNPYNHPVVRIAQLSAFLATSEFLFDNIIKCRTVQDLQLLFRAEASQYWSTHYIPGKRSDDRPKRIGHTKANLLGINLAVTLIFAYGDHLQDDQMKERAIDLLEKIVCENNVIIDAWRKKGVVMESAFDSQAMLQLSNEFCAKGLCWRCPVGRRVIKDLTPKII